MVRAGTGLSLPPTHSKARNDLSWQPSLTVRDAIRDMADRIKQNLARLREMPDQYEHKE